MKSGDAFVCPVCKEKSFVKKEVRMDGWTVAGEVFRCALCGSEIQPPKDDEKSEKTENKAEDSLRALLGVSDGPKTDAAASLREGERKFCKDCQHRVVNAFRMVCMLHEKDVGPMDDCPSFVRRKE